MKKKAEKIVRLDELPEYKEALSWAAEIRAKAEREIERNAVTAPPGVLRRVWEMMKSGVISEREGSAVELWNGVGSDYQNHTGRRLMENIALLPELEQDVKRWWMRQAGVGAKRVDAINFNVLKDTHYVCRNETDRLLKDALRKCIVAMLDDMPTAEELHKELSETTGRAVKLSEMTCALDALNAMSLDALGREWSVFDKQGLGVVGANLKALGLEFEEDCGFIWDADNVRAVAERYGERARACSNCLNWLVVDEQDTDKEWKGFCVSCWGSMDRAIFGAEADLAWQRIRPDMAALDRLVNMTRRTVEDTRDISVKLALIEGTTVNGARRLLAGVAAAEDETEGLKGCPLASSCPTLCGKLQRSGKRAFPIAPHSGDYRDCHYYGVVSITPDDADADMRERIASACLERAKQDMQTDRTHLSIARSIECWKDLPASSLTDEDAPENRLSVQSAMF